MIWLVLLFKSSILYRWDGVCRSAKCLLRVSESCMGLEQHEGEYITELFLLNNYIMNNTPWSSRLFGWTGLDDTEFELSDDVSPYRSTNQRTEENTAVVSVFGDGQISIIFALLLFKDLCMLPGWSSVLQKVSGFH